jgi:hypothetical protein
VRRGHGFSRTATRLDGTPSQVRGRTREAKLEKPCVGVAGGWRSADRSCLQPWGENGSVLAFGKRDGASVLAGSECSAPQVVAEFLSTQARRFDERVEKSGPIYPSAAHLALSTRLGRRCVGNACDSALRKREIVRF